ncbi:hypothetical protein VII00023_03763 [Vibrio ichthyoenteri ATCC 700023]|uniref:Uncharacterized protein n=1 Tax=Vibrio ichthyoenteri ATCC 700023 TaxID=870968 RepID=F9S865_9VIBR|nr:hypothetical protein VII00023_03763 [Vibrio ichthyoenteri ATCC 700023]
MFKHLDALVAFFVAIYATIHAFHATKKRNNATEMGFRWLFEMIV